jgi:uncharacterized UPF0160 family protein
MKIATHNGMFHADDVFSVAVLRQLGLVSSLIRTRDPKVLKDCYMRIDVGGKNNAAGGDYDHHQKGGAGNRENGIPYASFGLVWKQYGARVCGCLEVARFVEERLVQVIDAGDDGLDLCTGLKYPGVVPYSVSAAILAFNPSWQENPKPADFDRQFDSAVEVAKAVLQREIIRAKGETEARLLVQAGLACAGDPRLLILDRFCLWQDAVIEEAKDVLFVLLPSETGDSWQVWAVRDGKGSFNNRRCLPAEWAGKNNEELAKLTGVPDAIFCHKALFVAGAKSEDGALELARLALAAQ